MKGNQQPTQIYFNPKEVHILAMGLASVMETLNEAKDPSIPWTPEARKDQADMASAAKSAASKLERFAGAKCSLPPYNPGDENEFLTKQS